MDTLLAQHRCSAHVLHVWCWGYAGCRRRRWSMLYIATALFKPQHNTPSCIYRPRFPTSFYSTRIIVLALHPKCFIINTLSMGTISSTSLYSAASIFWTFGLYSATQAALIRWLCKWSISKLSSARSFYIFCSLVYVFFCSNTKCSLDMLF